MTLQDSIKIKKGDKSMSEVRRELSILAYERLLEEYLKLNNYQPTNGKFLASRPWLNLIKENNSFSIEYSNYANITFNEKDRDTFLSYILTEEDTVNEEKIEFLKNRPNLLTRKLRAVEQFIFISEAKDSIKDKRNNKNQNLFNNRYAPTITKGPVDVICSAVSRKDNFQKYSDVFDLIDNGENTCIKMDNYGIDCDINDVNLSIDVVTEQDNIILNNEDELNCFEAQLDKKIEEVSKHLSQDTERVLRYLQTMRYFEMKNKPVIDGYTAVMEIDVDDILRAFNLRICPKNRANILNQLNQISNLTLNIKVDKDIPKYRDGRKRNKKDTLYISSQLINFSYGILYSQEVKSESESALNYVDDLTNIDINTISKAKVNIAWTDVFERLYREGEQFLNLNLPQEVFKLPRYKIKDFDLCMYLARLSNSTLSNTKNKKKSIPTLSIRLIKLIEAMNATYEIDSTRKKGDKLKSILDVVEDSISLYVRNGILKESTLNEFKNNRALININNYKDFKVTLYFDKSKQLIENNVEELG